MQALRDGLPGPTRMRVRGGSMVPTLRPGDELLVAPVTARALRLGDWVLVRGAQGGFVHRYVGRRGDQLLTKGDAHRALDPSWPPEAVMGRVVEVTREGRCVYRRTPARMRREAVRAGAHRLGGAAFGALRGLWRRWRALLLALLGLALAVYGARASVGLAEFTLTVQEGQVLVAWETGSETDNLGFYLDRRVGDAGEFEDLTGFIRSGAEGAGAYYEHLDADVTPGVRYYYRLRDVPDDGSSGEIHTPEPPSVEVPEGTPTTPTPTATPGTPTPTVTPGTPSPSPTPTATPEPGATAAPTATPAPYVNFWADETDVQAGDCATVQWQTEHVLATYLDGAGVSGQGAKSYCPCETETHTLRVDYRDGTSEEFEITLDVTGECTEETARTPTVTSPLATPRPPTVTPTPRPTPTLSPSTPSPTSPPRPEGTASPTAATTLSPTAQPISAQTDATSPTDTPTPSPKPTLLPVEGLSPVVDARAASSIWLLIVGVIIGLGFIGGGLWLWRQQQ
jgi:hypothetical protein